MTTYFKVQAFDGNKRVRQIEVNTAENLNGKLRQFVVSEINITATLKSKKDIDAVIDLLQSSSLYDDPPTSSA